MHENANKTRKALNQNNVRTHSFCHFNFVTFISSVCMEQHITHCTLVLLMYKAFILSILNHSSCFENLAVLQHYYWPA